MLMLQKLAKKRKVKNLRFGGPSINSKKLTHGAGLHDANPKSRCKSGKKSKDSNMVDKIRHIPHKTNRLEQKHREDSSNVTPNIDDKDVLVIDSDDMIGDEDATMEYDDIFVNAYDHGAKMIFESFGGRMTVPGIGEVTLGTLFKKYRGDSGTVPPPSTALMEYIVAPLTLDQFHEDYTHKKPLLIARSSIAPDYYKHWVSVDDLNKLLERGELEWGVDFSVHKYSSDKDQRIDYIDEGISPLDLFSDGCSIRFYSPQSLLPSVWTITSLFEDYWGTKGGNNIYYTPSGYQGFAPHWDEVDAYLLQVSGSKVWKLWPPIKGCEYPRYYSEDFKYSDLEEETYQFELEAGDLLYIPRGWVHAGICQDDSHSLHMTLSIGYRHTWADLLRQYSEIAIKYMEERNSDYRKSLPRDLSRVFGSRHYYSIGSPYRPITNMDLDEIIKRGTSPEFCIEQADFNISKLIKKKVKKQLKKISESDDEDIDELISRRAIVARTFQHLVKQIFYVEAKELEQDEDLQQHLPLDEAVDRLSLDFEARRLPTRMPLYLADGHSKTPKGYQPPTHIDGVQISPLDQVRLVHVNCFAIMNKPIYTIDEKMSRNEEDSLYLIPNVLETETERSPIEIPLGVMGALLELKRQWPKYTTVRNIIIIDKDTIDTAISTEDKLLEDKVTLVQELYMEGLIEIRGQ